MACEVQRQGGETLILCSRGSRRPRCSSCGAPGAELLCDYPLKGRRTGSTCSKPICRRCAVHREPDHDLCPAHARLESPS